MYQLTENEQRALSVLESEMNRLRGKLFETVEAVGLPERQEEALKRLIRRQSYDSQNLCVSALRGVYKGDGSRP
jgi:hypothetical protein